MIKIVSTEVTCPSNKVGALGLDGSTAVRAVNLSHSHVKVFVVSADGGEMSLTVPPNDVVILKKGSSEVVYAESDTIRISGVSIY